MRNGVLGVMGEVVILRLSQDELDENSKKTRDQILDRLEVSISHCWLGLSISCS